ncbi:OCIA domain-containing protein 1 [Brachyhypopomus gauderio]|uniref:OCIA domain-containing protein 1 n=1 Tax=Brachyhypopomus gauderio TaxID=698409 RepID=UPI0040416DC9
MSQASSGYNNASQGPHRAQSPLGANYIPTEEETRVFKECEQDSFWYRSLPFSAVAVAVTQVMVTKGLLAPSPRFGSLPKVAIAGMLGYFGGKVSYMKVCEEKFKKLENSPIGEFVRQRHLGRHAGPESNPVEMADPDQASSQQSSFEATLQPTEDYNPPPNPYSSYTSDYTYSSPSPSHDPAPLSPGISESAVYSSRDNSAPTVPPYQDEEAPKKRAVLYEDLRSKNREIYEVSLSQRAEPLHKPQAEVTAPQREVKKNKYGDSWEE